VRFQEFNIYIRLWKNEFKMERKEKWFQNYLKKEKEKDDGFIKNTDSPMVVECSFNGLTGEEADRAFFGYSGG